MKPRSNSRDIGLSGDSHGAGKGDACRTTDNKSFRENFSNIVWDVIDPFLFSKRSGVKLIKKYVNCNK